MSDTSKHDPETIYQSIIPDGWDLLEVDEDGEEIPIKDEIRLLKSRYPKGEEIGHGGMKRILRVEDELMKRPVAQAFLLHPENEHHVERFFKEARLTGLLQHPNIVPLHDMGINAEGQPYFTMRLIHGDHLGVLLKELASGKRTMSLPALMEIFLKICDAIAYAHSNHIIHLDLKPENIHLGRFGQVLVCDWGLAKEVDAPEEMAADLLAADGRGEVTRFGQVKGSPGYMAPEQISNVHGLKDARTDIYALGALLYALLCHRPPVAGNSFSELMEKTEKGRVALPSRVVASVPEGLEAVAMKALSLKQADRYQTVEAIRSDVRRWLDGFATSAEGANVIRATGLLIRRHRTLFSMLLLLFISISVFAWQLFLKKQEAEDALVLFKQEQTEKVAALLQKELAEEAKLAEERLAARHLHQEAALKMDRYKYDEALELVEKAILRDADYSEAHSLKVQLLVWGRRYSDAERTYSYCGEHSQNYLGYKPFFDGIRVADGEVLSLEHLLSGFSMSRPVQVLCLRYVIQNRAAYSIKERRELLHRALRYHNPSLDAANVKIKTDRELIKVDVSGVEDFRVALALLMFDVTHLDASDSGLWYLSDIVRLPLVELKLSGTGISDYNRLAQVKTLKKLVVNEGAVLPDALKKGGVQIIFEAR